jgi:NADPH:quinone reductase-like Zn-dependent oxidoreductase
MMKALAFNPDRDQWNLRELPEPKVGAKDLLIRVEACALNPVDAKIIYWKQAVGDMTDTWVAGLDVSGTIVKMGREAKGWAVGERILTHGNMFRPHGGFAEYTLQDYRTIIPHPTLMPELAAATPCAGWTAWRALHDKLRITKDDSILITGGAGGVGGFAIQIAKIAGLSTIIVTTSAKNADYVRELGATHVIDYATEDIAKAVRTITKEEGVTRGLDCVGFGNDRIVADSLAYEGEMASIVETVEPKNYANAFQRALSFHQLSLGAGHRNGDKGRAALVRAGAAFTKLLEKGEIRVPKLETIPLEKAGPALVRMLERRTVGKIVIRME